MKISVPIKSENPTNEHLKQHLNEYLCSKLVTGKEKVTKTSRCTRSLSNTTKVVVKKL